MGTSFSYQRNSPKQKQGYHPSKSKGVTGKNDQGDPKKPSEMGDTAGSTGKNDGAAPKKQKGINSDNFQGYDFEDYKLLAFIRLLIGGGRQFADGKEFPGFVKSKLKSNFKSGPSWRAASEHLEYWHRGGTINEGLKRSNHLTIKTEAFWPTYANFLLKTVEDSFRPTLKKEIMTRIENGVIAPPNWECNGVTGTGKFTSQVDVYPTAFVEDGGLYFAIGAFPMKLRIWVRLLKRIRFGVTYSGDQLKNMDAIFMPQNDELEFEIAAASLQIHDTYDWHKGAAVALAGTVIKDDVFADAEPRFGRPYKMSSHELYLFGTSTAQSSFAAKNHNAFKNVTIKF